jgi:predicted ATPase
LRTGETKQEQRNLEKEIEIATTKDVMIEFKLRSNFSETSHALMDSGVGYSQVLPILVKSLLAEKGTTLIIEQPELHLNPALQVRLAEFFIAMTRAGKQILIESHSEHIVNAIRVLAAEDETGDVAKRSAIFYIDNVENLPRVFSLSIQEDGSVPEWPSTFFGEAATMTSRLLRAQKRFRNSKK